jgi:hypothetical protein
LLSLSGQATEVAEQEKLEAPESWAGGEIKELEQAEEKPKATRQRAKKVEAPEPDLGDTDTSYKAAKEVEVVEPKVLEVEELQEAISDIKIEDIRKLVAEKQAAHKDLLRAKLKEFGAANVTALPVQHYEAFYTLLNGLA